MATSPPHTSVLNALPAVDIVPSHSLQPDLDKLPSTASVSRATLSTELKYSMLAITDTREASWYGPWKIMLQILFMGFNLPYTYTVTVPQLPVIRGYDPAVEEDVEAAAQVTDTNDDEDDQTGSTSGEEDVFMDAGTEHVSNVDDVAATHRDAIMDRVANISPLRRKKWARDERYPTDEDAIIITDTAPASPITPERPARPTQPPNTRRTPSITLPNVSINTYPKIRSTRVPDFSQLVNFFNRVNKFIGSRLVLIVEIKPPGLRPGSLLNFAQSQVMDQARHAFASDKSLKVLGCIIASGNLWSYFEVAREDVTLSRKEAPKNPRRRASRVAKRNASPAMQIPVDTDIPALFLRPIFGDDTYLVLQDSFGRSDRAFARIYQHLYERMIEPTPVSA